MECRYLPGFTSAIRLNLLETVRTKSRRATTLLRYDYDRNGRLVSVSYPDETSLVALSGYRFGYNEAGQIDRLVSYTPSSQRNWTDSLVQCLKYDAHGRPDYQLVTYYEAARLSYADSTSYLYTSSGKLAVSRSYATDERYIVANRIVYRREYFNTFRYMADSVRLESMWIQDSIKMPILYAEDIGAKPWFQSTLGLANRISMAACLGGDISIWHALDQNGPLSQALDYSTRSYNRGAGAVDFRVYKNNIGEKGIYALNYNGWDVYILFTSPAKTYKP